MLKILKGNNDKRKEMEDGVRINGWKEKFVEEDVDDGEIIVKE
jgi:folate-dependent phosphoribosylglycinamide formyltransferase PurN